MNLVTDRKRYYKQTNNEIDPTVSCQCTSMVAALDILFNGDLSPIMKLGTHKQPEDNLRYYLGTDSSILTFCKKSHPDSKLHPSEWADVMIYGINKIYSQDLVFFESNITEDKIAQDLGRGKPVLVSMRYPEHRITGHYVLVVGFENNKWIVNDPYRNCLTWKEDGFNCLYTRADFKEHSKGYGIRFLEV